MRSLSVRNRFALVLVGLNIVAVAVLAWFGYQTSRESLTAQAKASARIIADAREQALTRTLYGQHDRMQAFLASVQSLCAESTSAKTMGWEPECVRVALSGFRQAERAIAVELRYGTRRLAATGSWPDGVTFPTSSSEPTAPSEHLASIAPTPGAPVYTMEAIQGRLRIRSVNQIAYLAPDFTNRSGLRTKDQVFLLDREGHVLLPVDAQSSNLSDRPAFADLMRRCLGGEDGDTLVDTPGGDHFLAGFQQVDAIDGGCAIAQLDYAEVLASLQHLGRLFALVSGLFIIVGTIVSLLVARTVTTAIGRLAGAARQLEAGHFDHAIPIAGPPEVRQLGRALSRMALAIGDLLRRESAARQAAETANRTKDDFLATLSHELRTPLTAILGWVTILRQQPGDGPRTDHALRVIERCARTEAQLIEDLLDVTRIINGQLRLALADASPIAVVDTAIESVRPAADLKGVTLYKHVEGAVGTVAADPHRLQQVLWNLLANSVRFTPRGGRVDVTVRQSGAATELRVSDTGIGITADLLPHVFERFRQGESGTMRTHGGLGLGLAIVRQIVELHGGTVQAESAGADCGATFIVTLPSVPVTPALQPTAWQFDGAAIDLHGACIVVADDDPDAREVLRTMLEIAGATVATSASARETRALIERLHPDVLIADIGMPGEDGYALIESIRARETSAHHLPAIALTARARTEDVTRALQAGFEVHVAKPVDAGRLLSTIATLLRRAA
jgi:signal transduction histidine kinase/ActR/RegA family two-component response regulator